MFCRVIMICLLSVVLSDLSAGTESLKNIKLIEPYCFGPSITDRTAWKKAAERIDEKTFLEYADQVLAESISRPPEELYFDFYKTGNRTRYQKKYWKLNGALSTLTLAACLTNDQKYIPKIEAVLMEYCKMPVWILPAHDRKKLNIEGKQIDIDLVSANVAWRLATVCYLLKPRLKKDVLEQVNQAIWERVITPFDDMVSGRRKPNYWLVGINNWNSVCLCGVGGAILTVEMDSAKRHFLLGKILKYSKNFLKGFGKDGYCLEGTAYWSYGYSHYLMLTAMVYGATDGKINLAKRSDAQKSLFYPEKILISEAGGPAFADCAFNATKPSSLVQLLRDCYTGNSSRFVETEKFYIKSHIDRALFYLFILPKFNLKQADLPDLPLYSSFDQCGIYIVRHGNESSNWLKNTLRSLYLMDDPCRLAFACKGGSNHEFHNHNDVGSYTIVVDGIAPITVDPGAEVYTSRTFGKQRYDSKLINSYGHPVPVIGGQLQVAGKGTDAVLLEQKNNENDCILKLDITNAYCHDKLKSLIREFIYSRENSGSLTVLDSMRATQPVTFETAILTFGSWRKIDDHNLEISYRNKTLNVAIDTNNVPFTISDEMINEDIRWKEKPCRIGIKLDTEVSTATVKLTYTIKD